MLYKKTSETELSDELFKNPTSEYRGAPFWAWNCKLEKNELARQIDIFREMGFGGFHMHVRTGLETPYLSEEFMEAVCSCTEKAKENEMLAYLYDEDRWPSGAAGGFVTKDRQYRARYLLFTNKPYETLGAAVGTNDSRADGGRNGEGELIAAYDVCLDKDGFLSSYKKIDKDAKPQGDKWYAYMEISSPSSWFNNQTYADTLNKKAIERFCEVTHERYRKYLEKDFGKTVPSIFTDEPQFTRKETFNNSFDKNDAVLPWTDLTAETYKNRFGEDITDFLPELFWDLPNGKISVHRYRYHDHIAETFASSFADVCGEWCRKNGIALTGHMMEEPTLRSQTAALGDAMRSYRSFDIPGIDMLCGNYEFTTAKQAQSAAHQFGREGVLSELYGVTGWDYDFRGYKLQGDWQAALGVTLRVPHLAWVSMAGEAKRDYPAAIGYQSPWHSEYSYIEDHFARVNTALTRGKPIVKVGVIHPVESYWLHWGPNDKSALVRDAMDERFQSITRMLLEGSIDFDFICESLLPRQCEKGGAPLRVGKAEYDAIVVPSCETLRSSTFDRLEEFAREGGKLIFIGSAPKYENAEPSERGKLLFDKSKVISFDRAELLDSLADNRTVTIRKKNGSLTDNLIYSMREDGECKWFFAAHSRDPYNKDVFSYENVRICFPEKYKVTVYDTISGKTYAADAEYSDTGTIVSLKMYDYDSVLLKLEKGSNPPKAAKKPLRFAEKRLAPEFTDYEIDEPNVLLLDMCEFSVDGGKFYEKEEILRADNIARSLLGLDKRGGGVAQPWVIPPEEPTHTITLRFGISSEIEVASPVLALEDAEKAEITLNGERVLSAITGYYVDKSIKTVPLPKISKGENILTVKLPIGSRTNTEWCYLLGDFGVRVCGRSAVITEKPKKLAFGDVTAQGLPFYGGCVTYKFNAESKNGSLTVTVPQYRGGVIKVFADGKDKGYIAFSPNTLSIEDLSDGTHEIALKLFTNRFNSFGTVHNADSKFSWQGPDSWRTGKEEWTYEYNLRPVGILSSPIISYSEQN